MMNSPLLGALEAELPGIVELEVSSVGCPREAEGDDRVAVTPESVRTLVDRGFRVLIEVHAGKQAGFPDEQYIRSGGKMVDKITVWTADVVLKLKAPASEEASLVSLGQTVVCLGPDLDAGVLEVCCTRRVNLFLLSRMPLLQKYLQYNAMSSMQNLAGYKAVLFAAHHFGRLLGGQCTAAGRVPPAVVVVLGCGVSGLAALAAARGMGAAVTCVASNSDSREQVRALGGLHLELTADSLQSQIAISDVVIVTDEYDGDPLTSQVCGLLRFGSVIVDLTGRLTELSRKDTSYTTPGGITVVGHSDMAALIPQQASKMYSSNITRFLLALESRRRPGQLAIDRGEDLARYTLVVLAGVALPPPPKVPTPKKCQLEPTVRQDASFSVALAVTAGCGVLMLMNLVVTRDVVLHLLVVLVLASAVAFQAASACSAVLYGPFVGLLCAFSGVTGMATASLLSASRTASWPLVGATVACEAVSAVGLLLTQDWVSCFSSSRATRYLYTIPGVLIPSLYLVARLILHDNVDFMTQVAGSLCCAGSVMSLSSVSEAEFATPLAAVGLIAGFVSALTAATQHSTVLRFLSLLAVMPTSMMPSKSSDLPLFVHGSQFVVSSALLVLFLSLTEASSLVVVAGSSMASFAGGLACASLLHAVGRAGRLAVLARYKKNVHLMCCTIAGCSIFYYTWRPRICAVLGSAAGCAMSGFVGGVTIEVPQRPHAVLVLVALTGSALTLSSISTTNTFSGIVGPLMTVSSLVLIKRLQRRVPFCKASSHHNCPTVARVTEVTPADVLRMLKGARRVIITGGADVTEGSIPQRVAELVSLLRGSGVTVAVDPPCSRVAGFGPLVLAEACVPVSVMTSSMDGADLCLVLGEGARVAPARDVVMFTPILGSQDSDSLNAEKFALLGDLVSTLYTVVDGLRSNVCVV